MKGEREPSEEEVAEVRAASVEIFKPDSPRNPDYPLLTNPTAEGNEGPKLVEVKALECWKGLLETTIGTSPTVFARVGWKACCRECGGVRMRWEPAMEPQSAAYDRKRAARRKAATRRELDPGTPSDRGVPPHLTKCCSQCNIQVFETEPDGFLPFVCLNCQKVPRAKDLGEVNQVAAQPRREQFATPRPGRFPTERRPVRRDIDWKTPMLEVDKWLKESGIVIGEMAETEDQKEVAARILWTWRNVFATDITEIRRTDLVEHHIPLVPNARPYQAKQHLYTPEERRWFDENIPKLLESNIICFCDSPWSAKSKFVRKTSGQLRFVNVFCPLNRATQKSVYPMQRAEVVTDTILQEGCNVFFACDGSNGYWGVPTAQADIYKTAFTTPNGQFAWTRIGQGLTGGPFTYSKFGNIAFGDIPQPAAEPALKGSHRVETTKPYRQMGPLMRLGEHDKGSREDGSQNVKGGKEDDAERDNGGRGDRGKDDKRETEGGSATADGREQDGGGNDKGGQADGSKAIGDTGSVQAEEKDVVADALEEQAERAARGERVNFSFFMDDTYGSATSFEAMAQFLHEHFFPRCDWAPMSLNGAKSVFWARQVDILGMTGSRHGLRPNQRKLELMREYPRPENYDEVEAFLYLTPFLRRFIPGRAEHARVIKSCVDKEGTFKWTEACERSFQHIKNSILENACMSGDPNTQYHLACDASKTGIGAVLFQILDAPPGTKACPATRDKERIVMFISQRLTPAEQNYATSDREGLAVVRALEEVRHLVLGSKYPVMVYTDHAALTTLLIGDATKGRIATWQNILSEFDLRISHVPGRELQLADGLSRIPHSAQWAAGPEEKAPELRLERVEQLDGSPKLVECLMAEIEDVEDLASLAARALEVVRQERGTEMEEPELTRMSEEQARAVIRKLEGWDEWLDSDWYGEVVYFKFTGRLKPREPTVEDRGNRRLRWVRHQARKYVVSQPHRGLLYREANGDLALCLLPTDVPEALYRLHNAHGHFFTAVNQKKALGKWYWPTRYKDIASYAKTCDACQRLGPAKQWRKTRPIFVLNPMGMLGMDFFGPISPPAASGNQYGFVVCDYMTRYIFLFPAKSPNFDAVKRSLDEVFRTYGKPIVIYSDGGSAFKASTKWLETEGITHIFAPPYHPQSVGLAESVVKMVLYRLRCFWVDNPEEVMSQWDHYLPEIAVNINTRDMKRFGYTPFELMFGRAYDPQHLQPIISKWTQDSEDTGVWEDLPSEDERIIGTNWIERTEETREHARWRLLEDQDKTIAREEARGWKVEKGDLVLLRHHALDKQHGEKLRTRWLGPFRVKAETRGNSLVLEHLEGNKVKGKYSMDSVKPYLARTDLKNWRAGMDVRSVLDYKHKGLDLSQLFEDFAWN